MREGADESDDRQSATSRQVSESESEGMTYVDVVDKLDQRGALLAEHDLHALDVAVAPKEREEPLGRLLRTIARSSQA